MVMAARKMASPCCKMMTRCSCKYISALSKAAPGSFNSERRMESRSMASCNSWKENSTSKSARAGVSAGTFARSTSRTREATRRRFSASSLMAVQLRFTRTRHESCAICLSSMLPWVPAKPRPSWPRLLSNARRTSVELKHSVQPEAGMIGHFVTHEGIEEHVAFHQPCLGHAAQDLEYLRAHIFGIGAGVAFGIFGELGQE